MTQRARHPDRKIWQGLTLVALAALVAWALRGISWLAVGDVLTRLTPLRLLALTAANILIILLFSSRWWLILRAQGYRIPYLSLAANRLAGFAISYFTPGSQFGGEPMQVYLLHERQGVPVAAAVASLTMDKLLELLSNFAFLVFGVAAILKGELTLGISPAVVLPWVVGLFGLLLGYTAALWIGFSPAGWLLHRYLVFNLGAGQSVLQSLSADAVQPRGWRWVKLLETLAAADQQVSAFCRARPWMVIQASLFSVVIWGALVTEYWLSLWLLGAPLNILQVISLLTVARLAFLAPIPGAVGVLEAGQILVLQAFGANPAIGVSLSLLIRLRDIAFGGLGFWLGAVLSRREAASPQLSQAGD